MGVGCIGALRLDTGGQGWRGIRYVPARRSRRVTALVAESPRSGACNWGRPDGQHKQWTENPGGDILSFVNRHKHADINKKA
jgi:hypothetical protein